MNPVDKESAERRKADRELFREKKGLGISDKERERRARIRRKLFSGYIGGGDIAIREYPDAYPVLCEDNRYRQ